MNALIPIVLFLNLVFVIREFFAVWEHITAAKNQGKLPDQEDYFEFIWAGCMVSITFFVFCLYSIR